MFAFSSKLKVSNYIQSIWILELKSGINVFEQNYSDVPMDSDLISGFFMALKNFGREITHGEIEEIAFNNMKIFLKSSKNLLLACSATEIASKKAMNELLDVILFEFEHQYGSIFTNWAGNCEIFLPFQDFVQRLLNKKRVSVDKLIDFPSKLDQKVGSQPKDEKRKVVDQFKKKMQHKGVKHAWWISHIKKKMGKHVHKELSTPKNELLLERIYRNRQRMEMARHQRIEWQMQRATDLVNKEMEWISSLPPDIVKRMVSSRVKITKTETTKIQQKNAKRRKKIEKKIRKLQDKLLNIGS
jgi:hypothetical protein